MNKPVTIVVLSKYKEIFMPFYESYMGYDPGIPLILVRDGDEVPDPNTLGGILLPVDRKVIQGPEKFAMAGNGNLGLKAVPKDHDILYCGDDVRFLEPHTVEKLQQIAYEAPEVGILSPRIIGRGSPTQVSPNDKITYCVPLQMWFPCVYIKRELIDKIGYLDERFNDFGSDDLDYCLRTKLAGYELAVTSEVAIQHEASPEGGPTTFVKKHGVASYRQQESAAFEKLRQKYNISVSELNQVITTGNVSVLIKAQEQPKKKGIGPNSTKEEQKEFLASRHLFIATPAYGGWLGTNYTHSILGLVNLCHDLGRQFGLERPVPNYTFSFMHNESLITRARNTMVNECIKNVPGATDFLFIDADIGFNPKDIISLLFHPEEVIAASCAKKNLRLDRVFKAGQDYAKMNGKAKDYSIQELEMMCGEFVINFPPGQQPTQFSLGDLVEVWDAGTGLMRIQTQVFDKFAKAFPDRWYLPLIGEHEAGKATPMYMYFQSRIDYDSAQHNAGGMPQYISEDYAFARDCRKAGIKVYVAPWLETSHMGSYYFRGSMRSVALAGGSLR